MHSGECHKCMRTCTGRFLPKGMRHAGLLYGERMRPVGGAPRGAAAPQLDGASPPAAAPRNNAPRYFRQGFGSGHRHKRRQYRGMWWKLREVWPPH
ncbi:hypothetical protein MTP99_000612 [Tenebrio molitor]|nr:hypothetical protein MTP99_000612 [Tenebrio molitor]